MSRTRTGPRAHARPAIRSSAWLGAWVAALLVLVLARPASAEVCPFGAEVASASYCAFFKQYSSGLTPADPRIAGRVGAGSTEPTRSIALVVGVSVYPHLGAGRADLPPARQDVANLVSFLINDQRFDEVIVLQDGDATAANINYFLQSYAPQQGLEYGGRARFLFAYTGHGLDKTQTAPAALLLSEATAADDIAHMYTLEDLRLRLQKVADRYFHVLALINACYGGNLFDIGSAGGNPSDPEEPGSYALTAGSDEHPVASFGGPTDGSIFFDFIISGIKSGQADTEFARLIAADGQLLQQGGITRLGALSTYLSTEIEIINHRGIQTTEGPLRLDKPWIGPVELANSIARGGFFFLSPVKVVSRQLSAPIDVPAGPLSSLPGHPEIKVFSAQESYPVRGIDVSQHEGDIDWDVVKQKNNLRFAYVRSSSWAGIDKAFARHWAEVKRVGLDRGGFHVFDYCLTPAQQMMFITSQVARDEGDLPFSLTVQLPARDFNKKEYGCYRALGLETIRSRVLELAGLLRQHYGKTPVIRGTRSNLSTVLDDRFNDVMIWLAIYKSSRKPTVADLGLKGSNPWTLWQYTGELTVPGIGDNVEGSVFFGSERRYAEFKSGQRNVALAAANR